MAGHDSAVAASGKQDQKEVLKLEKIITLPVASVSAAWAPDSRRILVDGAASYQPAGFVIDVETEKFSDPITTLNTGINDIYWSPDEKYIVVTKSTQIRLLSYPDFKLVATLNGRANEPCAYQDRGGAAFTTDSRFIWVACKLNGSAKPANNKYLAAVNISIPELKIVDRFMADAPKSVDSKSIYGHSNVSAQGDEIFLQSKLVLKKRNNNGRYESYSTGFSLTRRKRLFRDLSSAELSALGEGISGTVYLLPADNLLTTLSDVVWTPGSTRINSMEVVTMKADNRKKIASFSALKKLQVKRLAGGVLSRHRNMQIELVEKFVTEEEPVRHGAAATWLPGTTHKLETGNPRFSLIVWELPELILLQEMSFAAAFFWMGLSADGKRLAGLKGNQLYIYSVNE